MVDYKASIKRPFSDWKGLLLGSLIVFAISSVGFIILIPFLVISYLIPNSFIQYIPNILTTFIFAIPTVYFLKCGITAAGKDSKLPSWRNFGEYVRTGMTLGIILLLYSLPFMLLTSPIYSVILGPELYTEMQELNNVPLLERSTPEIQQREEQLAKQFLSKLPVFLPVVLFISLIWWLITTAASFRFMEKLTFKDAFDLPSIFRISFSPNYILPALISILILIASIIIVGVMSIVLIVTLIGIILVPFILLIYVYALGIILYSIMGQAYREVNYYLPKNTKT